MLAFSVILLLVGGIIADSSKCAPGCATDVGQLSDAEFWKGIDGAQFITDLDDDTHGEFIGDNPKAFTIYYSTGCKGAKTARKAFGGAAKNMTGKVAFGAVDCEKNSDNACWPIRGYPTFYFWRDGDFVEEYPGNEKNKAITAKAFVNYLSKR